MGCKVIMRFDEWDVKGLMSCVAFEEIDYCEMSGGK